MMLVQLSLVFYYPYGMLLYRIRGLGRTGVIEKIPVQEDSIDIGHDLSMGSMGDTSREQSLEPFEDHSKLPNGTGN